MLTVGEGTDTVYDFAQGQDVFGFTKGLTFESLIFSVVGTTTQISFADEVLAEVEGFTSTLSNSDFVSAV